MYAYLLLNGSVQVLLDAFTVKGMFASRLNGILRNVIAETANHSFGNMTRQIGITLALEDQVRLGPQG